MHNPKRIPCETVAAINFPAPPPTMKIGGLSLNGAESTISLSGSRLLRILAGIGGLALIGGAIFIGYMIFGESYHRTSRGGVKLMFFMMAIGGAGLWYMLGVCGVVLDVVASTIRVDSWLGLFKKVYDGADIDAVLLEIDAEDSQSMKIKFLLVGGKEISLNQSVQVDSKDSANMILLASIISMGYGKDIELRGRPREGCADFLELYDKLAGSNVGGVYEEAMAE
ncbi:MAG: hypothetical protein JXR97_06125 [Planctomycetes bacterium]|nr:hypothetical protein [Planctomycetota bacterium]